MNRRKPLKVGPTKRKKEDDCGCGSSKRVTSPKRIKKK